VIRPGLRRLIATDLGRHGRRLVASSLAVVIGVATMVLLVALALGLRGVLLGEVFPVDRVEVAPASRSLDLLALRFELGRETLTEEQLAVLRGLPGVSAVYPKLNLLFPALASGGESLLGATLQTEVVVEGVDPALVAGDVTGGFDWVPTERQVPCRSARDCPEGSYCGDGRYGTAGLCRPYVPAVLSRHLLELYNGSIRRAYGLPRLNPDFAVGLKFEVAFGASTLRAPAGGRVVRERLRIAGFSERAIPLGLTLPLDFVRGVNRSLGADEGGAPSAAILDLEDRRVLPEVVERVADLDLEVRDRGALRAATLMAVLLAVAGLLGGVVLVVATVAVAHAFYLVVDRRRRELGVLRAVGARRSDIRAVILGEAGVVGALAGAAGAAVALGLGRTLDVLGARHIPDFPYKPDSFFLFPWWLILGAFLLGVVAALAGAILPAAAAARRDPADVLTED
jgi:hypothetical protein